ncbi:hypothetical protein EYF80_000190 [Liparis tanakae]|uniref:Uncharacterized protein n=1 Tax=Liparis tanakae TaxID=230148 RepID=A0A4Z2JHZ1_9TELE|nr:hypothetical protein EYF80_000190 [Liparis tanakae]
MKLVRLTNQHLVSQNSLGSASITQPSRGQAGRDESIWRHAGTGGNISLCERKAIAPLLVYPVTG